MNKRATGYSLQITDDGKYRWLHYGTKPKPIDSETRLFPAAPGLYFGPPDSPRFRAPCGPMSRFAFKTLYMLDGAFACSILEYPDGSALVSLAAGYTYFPDTGDSTLRVNIHVSVVNYSILEIKMAEVLRSIRALPDYLPHMNMPKGWAITKRRGDRWMEGCLS